MDRGFVIDNTEGPGRRVSEWAAGAPRKSFWLGTKLPDEELVPIGAVPLFGLRLPRVVRTRQDFAAR